MGASWPRAGDASANIDNASTISLRTFTPKTRYATGITVERAVRPVNTERWGEGA